MVKYHSRLLFLMAVAVLSISISLPVFGADWQDCSPAGKPYSCFVSASGFKFEALDKDNNPNNELCNIPSGGFPVGGSALPTSFPQLLSKGWDGTSDANLWCYRLTPPPKGTTNNSLQHINVQVPVPYFPPPGAPPLIKLNGQVFTFTLSNGCSGDTTTGFEVGDLDACGIKFTYKVSISAGAAAQRFSFLTKVTPETQSLGKGPVIMAGKIGNSLEPGFILGPDMSSAYSVAGIPNSTCQILNGIPIYSKKNEFGCTEEMYMCHHTNVNCSKHPFTPDWFVDTGTGPGPPTDYALFDPELCYKLRNRNLKMTIKKISGDLINPSGDYITPTQTTLKEMGFVGGQNACREGIGIGIGSCGIWTTLSNGTKTIVSYNQSPPCPQPSNPSNLLVTKISSTSVRLTWKDNACIEDGFGIYRGTNSTNLSLLALAPGNLTNNCLGCTTCTPTSGVTYTDTGLAAGTYYYKVTAYMAGGGANGESGATNPPVSITVP